MGESPGYILVVYDDMYKRSIKRIIDFSVASVALFLLAPIFVVILVLLIFATRGKPLFFQERPGKNERVFKIIKFKSMNDKRDVDGKLLPDAQRLTRIGSFVRKTSLDEIPQLINVLKGDMSLIGPRPLLTRYLSYYTQREKLRHTVRPGITGWAQVNGRNTISWDERLELDVYYVENLSFKLDMMILWKTIQNVIHRKDIVIIPGETLSTLDKYRQ